MEREEMMRKKREEADACWAEYQETRSRERPRRESELARLKRVFAIRKNKRQKYSEIMRAARDRRDEAVKREREDNRRREDEAKRKCSEMAELERQRVRGALKKQLENDRRRRLAASKAKLQDVVVPARPSVVSLERSRVVRTSKQLAGEDKDIRILQDNMKSLHIDSTSRLGELRKVAKNLWDQIVHEEGVVYDLEEYLKYQDYELSRLRERERQIKSRAAVEKDLGMEIARGKYPPKARVVAKHEQHLVVGRDFGDKVRLFNGGLGEQVREKANRQWEEQRKLFQQAHGRKRVNKWDPSKLSRIQEVASGGQCGCQDGHDPYCLIETYELSVQPDASPQAPVAEQSHSGDTAGSEKQQQQQQEEPLGPSEEEGEEEESEEEECEEEECEEEEEDCDEEEEE